MSKKGAANNLYDGIQVAVLGASGFIGRWVARALCARGARLHLVVRDKVSARAIFTQFMVEGDVIGADLRDPGVVSSFFDCIRPAVTFNLADAATPAPLSLLVMLPVVLFFVPVVTPITSTAIWHCWFPPSAPPLRLTQHEPDPATTVPPQLLLTPFGIAT